MYMYRCIDQDKNCVLSRIASSDSVLPWKLVEIADVIAFTVIVVTAQVYTIVFALLGFVG